MIGLLIARLLSSTIVLTTIAAPDLAQPAQPPPVGELQAAVMARCGELEAAVTPWQAVVAELEARLTRDAGAGPADEGAVSYPALLRAAGAALHARHQPAMRRDAATAAFVTLKRRANARRLVTPAVLRVAARYQRAVLRFRAIDKRLMAALQRI